MGKIFDQKTILISSINEAGEPFISCAPFIKVGEKLYIYLSRCAEHYNNVIKHPKISIMIIEDESSAKTVFSRVKITFIATAKKMEEVPEHIWEAYRQGQHKNMLKALRKLDFDMFELELANGKITKGFGIAHNIHLIDGEWVEEPENIQRLGHGMKSRDEKLFL